MSYSVTPQIPDTSTQKRDVSKPNSEGEPTGGFPNGGVIVRRLLGPIQWAPLVAYFVVSFVVHMFRLSA